MDSIWQDITFGARMLRKSPAFTAVAVLSLAIGIGANTVVFGFVDASLLRSLAVTNPHELVVLGWRTRAGTEMPDVSTWGWYLRDDNGDGLGSSYSLPAFEAIRDRNEVLSSTFAFADAGRINVIVDNQAEHASGQYVSGNYYTALGVDPALGRLIVADDDRAAAGSVAVLSHGYWSRRFGESADVVGGTIRINNAPFTVIGVAPADFHGTLQVGDDPDVTVPLAHQSLVSTSSRDMTRPVFWWLHLMGRMRDGVTMAAAESHLNALFQQSVEADLFADGVPEQYTLPEIDLRPGYQGMTEQRSRMGLPLMIMGAVTGLVLVIACLNVANLLLARAGTRRREIAVRLSIGASRWRLVRQLLAESLVLSALAGTVGVVLATAGGELLFGAVAPADLYVAGVRTDARVLGFGLLVSLLTGVVFGLAPALRASRPNLTPALKEGAVEASRRGGALWGLRSLLVVQVALSLLLLITAGLFVRTLANLEREATGFDVRGVAILSMDLGLNGYDGPRQLAFYEDLRRRLNALPGAVAATVTSHSPVSGRISFTTLKVAGYEPAEDERMSVFYNFVSPEFFETFGVPLLLGRTIGAQDRDGSPMVAVVNEAFVDRFFPDATPIGQRLGLGAEGDAGEYEIVGVAANVKYQRLADQQYPVAHVALAQHPDALRSMTIALRTGGDTTEAISAARRIVRQADPDIPLFDVRTLAEQQAQTLQLELVLARLSSALGVLALALASMGLYGVLSYSVDRRTREIGVRMALGARSMDVMRLVMHEVRAVILGVVIGIAAALAVTGLLESQMYGLSTNDPITIVGATVALLLVAAAAAYVPARRAFTVDPIVALRSE